LHLIITPALAATLAALAGPASAQDSHYATNLYGDRSTLLGGAVIASVDDASAAYYNPAALGDVAASDVFLGTKIFDFTQISLSGDGQEDVTLNTDDLGKAPSFIGGMIPIKSERHRFAYSLFKRSSFKFRLTDTAVGDFNILPLRNATSARLHIDLDTNLNEDWLGISWGYGLSEHTSVGVSNYFSYRSHRFSSLRTVETYRADGNLATAIISREYKYSYLSLLWKFGIKQQVNERLDLGFSFTTPSVKFGPSGFSEGKAGLSASVGGATTVEGDPIDDKFAADFQRDLPTTYRSPVAFGLGGSYRFGKRTIHLSAEFFGSVATYNVLDPEQFIAQSSGDTLDHQVVGGNSSVLNIGVGLQEHFGESIEGFFGFHTDFSHSTDDRGSVYATGWDLYHLTGGSQFMFADAQFTLGLGYSFGGETSNTYLTVEDVLSEENIQIDLVSTKANFRRLKIILGFGIRT
jgi:hypothetical protein